MVDSIPNHLKGHVSGFKGPHGSSKSKSHASIDILDCRHSGLDQLDGFLLHVHNQGIDARAIVAIADERRNGDGQSGRRRDQRLGNTAGEQEMITEYRYLLMPFSSVVIQIPPARVTGTYAASGGAEGPFFDPVGESP